MSYSTQYYFQNSYRNGFATKFSSILNIKKKNIINFHINEKIQKKH